MLSVPIHVGHLRRNLGVALAGLSEHRQRAVLSALGVAVGSLAIVLLISIARGIQADVSRQVDELGVNMLVVLPARFTGDNMFAPGLMGISRLEDRDVDRIRRVPGVRRASPMTFVGAGLPEPQNAKSATPQNEESVFVVAAGSEWFAMRPWIVREGRLPAAADDGRNVCVIGSGAAEKLFGKKPPLGRRVMCGGIPYEVVGVTDMAQKTDSMFSQAFLQDVVYVPYATIRARTKGVQINRIVIQTLPEAEPKALVKAVDEALAERLRKDDYSVMTPEDLLKMIYRLMGILTWLLTGLTSIGLFIGGVGIMTVMLMSVNERAKEIGIRMTVGARRSDVFQQFLCEAASISLGGGAAGLAFGYLVGLGLSLWTPLKPLVSPGLCALTLSVCLAVGVAFGLMPALKAARQQPIDSLRHE